jgi:hypothetical protein
MTKTSALLASVVLLLTASCKKAEHKPADAPPPAAEPGKPGAAPAAPTQPAAAAAAKLDGTTLTAVPCGIEGAGKAFIRTLYVDDKDVLYVLDDDRKPLKIAPGAGPCNLAAAGLVEPPLTIGADGAIVTGKGEKADCESDDFSSFAFDALSLGNGKVLVHKDDALHVEDRSKTPCTRAPFSKDASDEVYDMGRNASLVLLGHKESSGSDENAVWRFKPDGTLVDKTIGRAPENKSYLGWLDEVATCGEGVCATEGKELKIFDAAGKKLATHNLHDVIKEPKSFEVKDLVEIGGKAVYVLISYKDAKDQPVADLVRLDGIYAK